MKGWLLDTNVIATLANPAGAPTVKAWAAGQPEDRFFLSILTFGEYDKGIQKLATDDPERSRYTAARDALEARFAGRILTVANPIIRQWGSISGTVKRQTGLWPSVIDTLLAATAIEHQLILATRNIRDVQASGAVLFDPWKDDPADFPLT